MYDEYESFGDVDSEIYVKCIRKRMKYLRDHMKISLKELVVNEDDDEEEEDFSGISDKDLIAVFEKEAKNCGCCKWPEELVKDKTTEGFGNVYKSSMFNYVYRISYGYQYTCYPCQTRNTAISDDLAELIVLNNTK